MPIPQKYRAAEAKVVSVLVQLIKDIRDYQDDYFDEHKRYWQGLATHSVIPSETSEGPADKTARSCADRQHLDPTGVDGEGNVTYETVDDDSWDATGITLPPECSVSVHTVEGSKGHGWSIECQIKVGEDTVHIHRHFGAHKRTDKTVVRTRDGDIL